MKVRRASINDIPDIIRIKIKTWQYAYQGIIAEDYLQNMKADRLERKMLLYFDNCFRLVILEEDTNQIIGMCMYGQRQEPEVEGLAEYDSEICALYVDPEYHRKGAGKQLLQAALEDLKKRGKRKTLLWCLKENIPSRNFYETMGGKKIGEKKLRLNDVEYEEIGYGYNLK